MCNPSWKIHLQKLTSPIFRVIQRNMLRAPEFYFLRWPKIEGEIVPFMKKVIK